MSKWINDIQTPHERRTKYNFIRYCGLSRNMANCMRDWSLGHIINYLFGNIHYENEAWQTYGLNNKGIKEE